MGDVEVPENKATLLPRRPGERLRDAREAQGLTIADVAARTRIPTRHLEALEVGDYTGLPSITYAVGFAKAYARAIGLDEVAVARDIRSDVGGSMEREPARPSYVPIDPARTPSRGVVWIGVALAVLLLIGAGLWFGTDLLRGGASVDVVAVETPIANDTLAVPPPGGVAREATPATGGQVVLTANDEVWVRVYDGKDETLYMRTMAPGDRYEVPADAQNPMIHIGRPDKLAVTVNGSAVPPLGDGRVAIKDVPIGAAALLARASAPTGPTAGNSADAL